VSHEVLARMKQLMVDNNTAASHSFLLDDDSSIPFSLDDIAALMEDKARLTFARAYNSSLRTTVMRSSFRPGVSRVDATHDVQLDMCAAYAADAWGRTTTWQDARAAPAKL